MANSLHAVFHAFATAKDEYQLRIRFMDMVGAYFDVQSWGICLFDDQSNLTSFDVQGVSESVVERYHEAGRTVDPLLRYVVERHAPVHEQLVLGSGGWEHNEFSRHFKSRHERPHLMAGPLVGKGQLVGTVHFGRGGDAAAFTIEDLFDLSAICCHFSACLVMLGATSIQVHSLLTSRLTKREHQIVELVARGMTNAEIGAELWIQPDSVKQALKRIFRKLDVSSRTEMVVKLQRE
jgi:DNA-binding CsgD family transcriptional regulator